MKSTSFTCQSGVAATGYSARANRIGASSVLYRQILPGLEEIPIPLLAIHGRGKKRCQEHNFRLSAFPKYR